MVFEHFALNINKIDEVVSWYEAHMGLKIVSEQKEAPFMIFFG